MTVGRPSDWSPLGLDGDPVPGDPATVAAESRRLGKTVEELRAQIAMLQKISEDTTLKGQYASTLRAHAQQLSQDLGKVAVRYEKVAAATSDWSGKLAEAQATSLTALSMAEGPYEQLRRLQAPQPPPSNASSSAKQQYAADKQQYQNAESSAQAAMQAAQRLLGEATGNRDAAGSRTAQKISEASHDSLTDSFWDQFKKMITSIAGHLKLAATILGYLATICAILAVVLTGPLGLVFLLIAGGLLLTELGIHTLLAATGNGSWIDVGLDILALATLGYGGALDAGAEAAEETVEEAGTEAIQESQGLFGAAKGLLDEASGLEKDAQALGDEELAQLAKDAQGVAGKVVALSQAFAKDDMEALQEEITEGQGSISGMIKGVIRYGSRGMAKALGVTLKLSERFPEDTDIGQALSKLKVLGTKNAINFLSGTTIDALDKTMGLFSPTYGHFKDDASGTLPADIGVPVVTAAEVFGPIGFILHMTELASR
jgi:hypothetical protein